MCLLHVVLELFFEDCAGLADACLDGAYGDLEFGGDFYVFVPDDVHVHDLWGIAGEVVDGGVYVVGEGLAVAAVVFEGFVCERGVDEVDGVGVLFLLDAVDEGVAHDGVRPSGELAAARLEGVGVAECAGEGFLQEVVGAVLLACEGVGISPKLSLQ